MERIKLIFVCVLLTASAFSQSGSSVKTPQKGSNSPTVTNQFVGVYCFGLKVNKKYNCLEFDRMNAYFQDCKNCKKYKLDLKSIDCTYSKEPKPCRIVGHIKNNIIVCDSILTNFTQSVHDSILIKYTNDCKVKK